MDTSIPYKFIAIEGNIGAGKTTLASLLADRFNAKLVLEQFTDNPFLPYFYQEPARYGFPLEIFFLIERFKQMQEITHPGDLFRSKTVSDYFYVKTLLFARNNLNDSEFKIFQNVFQSLSHQIVKPDILIYLHRPVEVLLQQIQSRGRTFETQITAEYLSNIQHHYFEFFRMNIHLPILVLNLDDKNFITESQLLDDIISLLKKDYTTKTHFISLH